MKTILKKFSTKINKTTPFIYNNEFGNINLSLRTKYDAVIVGAGHNGLVCANYLAKAGKSVLILEKRHIVGGCAVTEELFEGHKFSRCSYVLALFRKKVIDELFGDNFYKNIKLIKRNPKGLTITTEEGKYLLRPAERDLLKKEIAKFSTKDAIKIDELDKALSKMVAIVDPLLDMAPPTKINLFDPNFINFAKHFFKHRNDLFEFYSFITSSADHYLSKYLEGDLLKATYATDAVIGAMKSPKTPGSAYVLLHHVMGTLDAEGSWFYVEGGNGNLTKFLADQAVEKGATIALNSPVDKLIINKKLKSTEGVIINFNGELKEIRADNVITNCDMYTTYTKLINDEELSILFPENVIKEIKSIDYSSPAVKINLAVDKLPNLKCLAPLYKNGEDLNKIALKHMTGTIHMNSENVELLDNAYREALNGQPSKHPLIEMTIPSLLDKTLVPKGSGHHVIGLFCQWAPPQSASKWKKEDKQAFVKTVYQEIERYSPGFTQSIIFEDILAPADLENEFSIRGGNIFHGAMDLNSIFFARPFYGFSSYKHFNNLFSCSSSMHPGGGVMGAAGRNCAHRILNKN